MKYEEVYLNAYADGRHARADLGRLLSVLQRPETPPGLGVPYTGGSVQRGLGTIDRTLGREKVVDRQRLAKPLEDSGHLT